MRDAKIAVIGANGQLGSEIINVIGSNPKYSGMSVTAFVHDKCDVADYPLRDSCLCVKHIDVCDLNRIRNHIMYFDVVINTAAYHNVAACEKNPDIAYDVNTTGSCNIAERCQEISARYVLISTDYVFGSEPPYDEEVGYLPECHRNPMNVYGRSKSIAEETALERCYRPLIARCSSLYGGTCRGKPGDNIIDWLYNTLTNGETINAYCNTAITLTYAHQAAIKLMEQLFVDSYANSYGGCIHLNDSGIVSHYDIAKFMAELFNINDANIVPTTCKQGIKPLKTPLQPLDGSLNWKTSLTQYLTFKGWYHKDEIS